MKDCIWSIYIKTCHQLKKSKIIQFHNLKTKICIVLNFVNGAVLQWQKVPKFLHSTDVDAIVIHFNNEQTDW